MTTRLEAEEILFNLEEAYGVSLDDDSFEFLQDSIASSPSLDPEALVQHHYEQGDLSFVDGEGPEDIENDSVDPPDPGAIDGGELDERIADLEDRLGFVPPEEQVSPDLGALIASQLKAAAKTEGHELRNAWFNRAFSLVLDGTPAGEAVPFVLNDPESGQVAHDATWERDFREQVADLAKEQGMALRGLPPAIVDRLRQEHQEGIPDGESHTEYEVDVRDSFRQIYGTPHSPDLIDERDRDLSGEIARLERLRDQDAGRLQAKIGKHGTDETPVTTEQVTALREKYDAELRELESTKLKTLSELRAAGQVDFEALWGEAPDPHTVAANAEIAELAEAGRRAGVNATEEQRAAQMAHGLAQVGTPADDDGPDNDEPAVSPEAEAAELAALKEAMAGGS